MPSQRKRIGFLPSEKVQDIIEKLCKANKCSQSKVTGLLVEEALRSRGVLSDSLTIYSNEKSNFINFSFEDEPFLKNKKFHDNSDNSDNYKVNKETFLDEIKMMHEFVEFKYFKKVMKQNKNIFGNEV